MSDLGLQVLAQQSLGYLVAEYDFIITVSTSHCVRFESNNIFLEIIFDENRSFELSLLVGKKNAVNLTFSIDEILRFYDAPQAKSFSLVQVTTAETLAAWIDKFAQMLRRYGIDLITGKESSFAKLVEQRRIESQNYSLERDLRMARADAEAAWHRKDYSAVVKALSPFLNALTVSEVRKLEYAEKQCKG